ncbi:hypothetical protein FJZ39_02300 [Candidatus Saccharibacteria bacterium]|nr:hypothetical protein [Candidatus Saccharibacteria bacterium]
MNRGNFSRTLPIILVVVIIIVAIVAIISLGRAMFGGGDDANEATTSQPADDGRAALLATDTTRSVRFTQRGPIVADENFRSYQITVSTDNRTITAYEGYLQNALDSKTYANNSRAYEEFVFALDKANMMNGDAFEGEADDTRGLCATGNVYEYEVLQGNRVVKRLWSTDCDGSKGSLEASVEQLNNLFHNQVPDSDEVLEQAGMRQGGFGLFSL